MKCVEEKKVNKVYNYVCRAKLLYVLQYIAILRYRRPNTCYCPKLLPFLDVYYFSKMFHFL